MKRTESKDALPKRIHELEKTVAHLENALEESEKRFSGFYNNTLVGFFRSRLSDGTLVECNERFALRAGYSSREECRRLYRPEKHFAEPGARDRMIGKLREDGEIDNYEISILRLDGAPAWVSLSARMCPGGEILEGAVIDITLHKSTMDRLHRSEELYRKLVEDINEMILVVDEKGVVTYVSPMIFEIGGDRPEDVVGRSVMDFIHPDDRDGMRENMMRRVSGGEGRGNYYRILTSLGIKWMSVSSRPIFYSGKLAGIYCVMSDVTERKLMEEELRRSEEKYRLIAENMNDIVWATDLDFHTTYVSPSIEKVLGFTPEERLRQTLEEMVAPETLGRVQARFLEEMKLESEGNADPGRSITMEAEYYRKDGSTLWMENTALAIRDASGAVTGIYGVSRDISERRFAEAALRDSEERYRSLFNNAQVGLFRSGIHDGRIIACNIRFARLTGCESQAECCERYASIGGFFHRAEWARMMGELMSRGELSGYEINIFRRDGAAIRTSFTGKAYLDGGYIEGAIVDITDLKSAMERLRRSEERNSLILKTAMDGLLVFDAGGNILLVNDALSAITGYSLDELSGMNIDALFYGSSISGRQALVEMIKKGPRRYGTRIRSRSGAELDVELSATYMRNQDCVFGFMRDMTAQKEAERALSESERRLNNILHGSPIPTFVINRDHRVILWNKALEEYSSIKAEDIIGTRDQWRAFYPAPRPCLADLIADGEFDDIERHYGGKHSKSSIIDNAYTVIDYFEHLHGGTWFLFTAAPIYDSLGNFVGAIETLQDITARKKAEEALRQSEEKYRLIFDHAPLAIFHVDKTGVVTACNDELARIVGVSRGAIVGVNLLKVPDDTLRQSVKDALGGEQRRHEGEYQSASAGKSAVLRGMFVPMRSGGDIIGCFGIFEDITERKRADDALKASELKYWTVANFTNDWVYWIGAEGMYVYVSPSCERVTGYPAGEFLEDPELTLRIVHPEDYGLFCDHWIVHFRDPGPCELTYRIIRKDGEVRHINHNCLPVVDADGAFLGRRGSNRDVTGQFRAEEKIRRGEAIARALIDTPGEPVLVIDTAHVILDSNIAFRSYRKRPRGDVIGSTLREILEDDRCEVWEGMIAKVKESGIPRHFEESREDGWYETSIFPVRDETGRVDRFVIETRDISEIVRMQKHIMHVSELERMSIGQEIHDGLGQELTGVAFLVEVLEQKMMERGYAEVPDIRRIADLIGRSIDHARLMSRTMFPARLEREGITAALADLTGMTGGIFKIDCTCEVDAALKDLDPGKANQFYHIALEAVNNAIKHGGPSRIHISLRETGSHVGLEVWNDGKGMDEKSSRRAGIGYNIMKYRAKILNGEFRSGNARDGGFRVSVRVAKDDL